MNIRTWSLISLPLMTLASLVACSSTTTDSAASAPAADAGSDAQGTDGGTDAAVTDSGRTATGDDAFRAESARAACTSCCTDNHPAGTQFLQNALVAWLYKGTRAADGGAPPCADVSADSACLPTPKPSSAAGSTCITSAIADNGACKKGVAAACLTDADCDVTCA